MLARVDEHTGEAAYAFVNCIPAPASLLMCGVSWNWWPYDSTSGQPRSSTRMKTMFGGVLAVVGGSTRLDSLPNDATDIAAMSPAVNMPFRDRSVILPDPSVFFPRSFRDPSVTLVSRYRPGPMVRGV